MAWSQTRVGGNSWEASSENTFVNWRYCTGILVFSAGDIVLDSKTSHARKSWSTCVGLEGTGGDLRGKNHALAASLAQRIIGKCEISIHVRHQSMLGCTTENHG